MKKMYVFAALLLVNCAVYAQTASVKRAQEVVQKALNETNDPKKGSKPAAWLKLGDSYLKLYDTEMGDGASFLFNTNTELVKYYLAGDPVLSEENVRVADMDLVKRCYEGHNYYFDANGVIRIAERSNSVCPDALSLSLQAFRKAAEIDVNGSKGKDICEAFKILNGKFRSEAENAYHFGRYQESSDYFKLAVDALASKPLELIDTLSQYNVAFTAMPSGDYARAKEYYGKSLDVGYYADGMTYYKLSEISGIDGDRESQLAYLEEGFKKFPQCQYVLFGLINYYNSNNLDSSRLFELLGQVKALDPGNASIYAVEGGAYEKLGNYEKAAESYRECISIMPDKPDGYYQLGVMYYNMASTVSTEMMEIDDAAKLDSMAIKVKENLKLCIEPLEKVLELSPAGNASALQGLKSACFQLRNDGEEYMQKYETYKKMQEQSETAQ